MARIRRLFNRRASRFKRNEHMRGILTAVQSKRARRGRDDQEGCTPLPLATGQKGIPDLFWPVPVTSGQIVRTTQ